MIYSHLLPSPTAFLHACCSLLSHSLPFFSQLHPALASICIYLCVCMRIYVCIDMGLCRCEYGCVSATQLVCGDQKTTLGVSPCLLPCLDRFSCFGFSCCICQDSWPLSQLLGILPCLSPIPQQEHWIIDVWSTVSGFPQGPAGSGDLNLSPHA